MKIRRTSDSRISFELCEQDLSALNIDKSSLNLFDKGTKDLLCTILKRIYPQSVCDLDDSAKIIVDSSKNQLGNCALKLTLLKNEKHKSKSTCCCATIFEFENIDSLLDAAFSCNGEILLKKSSLYEKNGIYRLVIYPEGDSKACLILNEFCSNIFSSDMELFKTFEYFSCICSEHALSSLCLRFVF